MQPIHLVESPPCLLSAFGVHLHSLVGAFHVDLGTLAAEEASFEDKVPLSSFLTQTVSLYHSRGHHDFLMLGYYVMTAEGGDGAAHCNVIVYAIFL